MASEWQKMTLREAGVSLIDCDHRTPPAATHGAPYVAIPQMKAGRIEFAEARRISAAHLAEWTRKAKPQANDVILSRRCNPGETAFVRGDVDFALGQNLVLLRADGRKVHREFLRWLVRGPEWWRQVQKFINVGAVFDSLKCADIPKFDLLIPPLDEQKRIAHILGTLDDKIELNRRMNATLEAMARALFQSWFVDFDPVRAKAAGQTPVGMDPATAALFPSDFEESALGEIPKGWKISTVADEFNLTMGQSPPGSTYNEVGEGAPFYQGRTDFGFRFPTRRVYCTAPTRLANPGDTLVSVRAPVGDLNIAEEQCAIGRGVAAIRHRSGSRSMTYYAMETFRERFNHFEGEGTVFGSINRKDFERLSFLAPPADLVKRFDRIASQMDGAVENNERQSRTLAALRDALLPKLLSGELSATDAQQEVES